MERLMVRKIFFSLYCLLSVGIGIGFSQKQTVILLSKSYGNGVYDRWLMRQNPSLKLVSLYHCRKDSVEYWLKKADGFLMTGGEDIHPSRYGKEKDTLDCGDFDLHRDTLEFKMLDQAFSSKKPVFGICRGFQILNVYKKGTLVVDIPTTLGTKVLHRNEGPVKHLVTVSGKLKQICGTGQDSVVSNHHQGVEKLGEGLVPLSTTSDGLIEAFSNSDQKLPFLMAVQWHPEKMSEGSPLSEPLARVFVKACVETSQKRK
jgi:gamma-glutamyl-gamma-aminobutyrate hydrolase PuuD